MSSRNKEYYTLTKNDIPKVMGILTKEHMNEVRSVPSLPDINEVKSILTTFVDNLFEYGIGIGVKVDGELKGFIMGFKADELFGKDKGIYIPVYGHGFKEGFEDLLVPLYIEYANMCVKEKYFSHVVTSYAHNDKAIESWFNLGFGKRCVDSISKVTTFHQNQYEIKKLEGKEVFTLRELHDGLINHLSESPTFIPFRNCVEEDLLEWSTSLDYHIWALYIDDKPKGFMIIRPTGESFISRHQSIMNIVGAYVLPSERKTGLGVALLKEVHNWMNDNNFPLLAVDYESLNPLANRFWTKHFTPYCYTLTRRIDERV